MSNDATLRLVVTAILGIIFIGIGIVGRPGSILGAIIDPESMVLT